MTKILILGDSYDKEAILKAAKEFNEVEFGKEKKFNETKRYTQYRVNNIHNRKPGILIS